MALLILTNKQRINVTAEKGAEIWRVLNNEQDPTPEQETFCLTVDKIFLNWRTAPDSYIQRNFETIKEKAMSEWICGLDGIPLRPNDTFDWDFAKKWKLPIKPYTKKILN